MHRVVALVRPVQSTFELGCAVEVFGTQREGIPQHYEFQVCTETPGPVPTTAGYAMSVPRGLSALACADTVLIPGWKPVEAPLSARVRRALLRAHARGARLVTICSGVFALARTGHVDVLGRAAEIGEVGSGISLWANGMRALDSLGLGDQVRAAGLIETKGGIRDRAGRWLSKTDTDALVRWHGPLVAIRRTDLFAILSAVLPADAMRLGIAVTGIESHGTAVTVVHSHGSSRADLVIGADGIRSIVRESLWRQARGPRYAGYTAWRMITSPLDFTPDGSETWGRGERFGVVPLADSCAYLFAVANAPEGKDHPGREFAELQRRFGDWPEPIPAALAAVHPDTVLRHDIYDLPALDTFVCGRVALLGDAAHAMTPNIGQGTNQALEDAVALGAMLDQHPIETALTSYDDLRRRRTAHCATIQPHRRRRPMVIPSRNHIARQRHPARPELRDAAEPGSGPYLASAGMRVPHLCPRLPESPPGGLGSRVATAGFTAGFQLLPARPAAAQW